MKYADIPAPTGYATDVTIQDDPISGVVIGAIGIAIGVYFIQQGRQWRDVPARRRAAMRLPVGAGRFHRHPTLSIVIGVIGIAVSASIMLASVYFALAR